MKKFIFYIFFSFFFTAYVFAVQGAVEDISGPKYVPAVGQAISEARESIYMAMYIISLSPRDRNTPVFRLVDELVRARERGVEVKVILDQNIDFVHTQFGAKKEVQTKSSWAFKRLKEAGAEVYYDEPARYAHAKVIVIDNETVILGSANWTNSALTSSIEANVLIRDKGLAGELVAYLDSIKLDEEQVSYFEALGPSVPISLRFIEDPRLAPRMISRQDERAFDLYLILLKSFKGGEIVLDMDVTARKLGIDYMNRTDYRRQIIKVLRRLEKRYKLIKVEFSFAKEARVELLDYEDKTKSYTLPAGRFFSLPVRYFEYGWDRILNHRAKFVYLVSLAEADISDVKPWWTAGRVWLSKRYRVSRYTIEQGLKELRDQNLIEVVYDKLLVGEPYEKRSPNSYKMLPLYDPRRLKEALEGLKGKYGEGLFNKALNYAGIVYKTKDAGVIEDIINKMDEYGEERVDKAFRIVAQKSRGNPKRSYGYAVGVIKGMRN